MNHFDIADWADYARNLLDAEARRRMEDHLAGGCGRCRRSLTAFERVAEVARADLHQAPPEYAQRLAKALTALRLPDRAGGATLLVLQLAFDSFLEPAPTGIRGGEISSRHLVYYAQDYALDLRLEHEAETEMLLLGGEILDRRSGPVANVPAFLMADDQVVSRSVSGSLGEFSMSCGGEGSLRLCLVLNEDECIEVSLDQRRREPAAN